MGIDVEEYLSGMEEDKRRAHERCRELNIDARSKGEVAGYLVQKKTYADGKDYVIPFETIGNWAIFTLKIYTAYDMNGVKIIEVASGNAESAKKEIEDRLLKSGDANAWRRFINNDRFVVER